MTPLTDLLTLIALGGTVGSIIVGAIAGLYHVTAGPRLERIEGHLVRLNGSVADAVTDAAAHKADHPGATRR